MKKPTNPISESRRSFLRKAGASGGAAVVAAAAPAAAIAETPEAEATTGKPAEGYRLTRHILDYYKSAAD